MLWRVPKREGLRQSGTSRAGDGMDGMGSCYTISDSMNLAFIELWTDWTYFFNEHQTDRALCNCMKFGRTDFFSFIDVAIFRYFSANIQTFWDIFHQIAKV